MTTTTSKPPKGCQKAALALMVIICVLATVTSANAADLYVNASHPSCNNTATRTMASNISTPWCNLDAPLTDDLALPGDTIIIGSGIYNAGTDGSYDSFDIVGWNISSNLTIKGCEGCSVYLMSNNTHGTCDNASSVKLGMWSCNDSGVTGAGTSYTRVYLGNGSRFFIYDSYADFLNCPYSRCSWTNVTPSPDKTLLYFNNTGTNPNSLDIKKVKSYSPLRLNDNHAGGGHIIIENIIFQNMINGVYIVNTTDVIIRNCSFIGGYNPINVDGDDVTNIGGEIEITGNYFHGHILHDIVIDDVKANIPEEMDTIFFEDFYGTAIIHGNRFEYVQGCIAGKTDVYNMMPNSKVYNNNVTHNYGSCFEIENFCYNSSWYNNRITDCHYSGVSFAPANAMRSPSPCQFYNNLIDCPHKYSESTYGAYNTDPYAIKAQSRVSGANNASNWNITGNTFKSLGRALNTMDWSTGGSTLGTWVNTTFKDNIFYSNHSTTYSYTITGTGQSNNNVFWDYNLYFLEPGGYRLFSRYNNQSGCVYATLADAIAGTCQGSSGWNANSVQSDPLFVTGTQTPSYLSPACTMSSTGSYVGALPCQGQFDNPGNITNLTSPSQGADWIYAEWENPLDVDYDVTRVYLNGTSITNTTESSYNFTGLLNGTYYNISLLAVDYYGNEGNTISIRNSTLIPTPIEYGCIVYTTYQENESSDYNSTTSVSADKANFVDGNWNTYSYKNFASTGKYYYYETYNKPPYAKSVKINYKMGIEGIMSVDINKSTYPDCWDYSDTNITIMMTSGAGSSNEDYAFVMIACKESSGYENILGGVTTTEDIYYLGGNYIYETNATWTIGPDYIIIIESILDLNNTEIIQTYTVNNTITRGITSGTTPICSFAKEGNNQLIINTSNYYPLTTNITVNSNTTTNITGLANTYISFITSTGDTDITPSCYYEDNKTTTFNITNKYAVLPSGNTTIYCNLSIGSSSLFNGNFTMNKTEGTLNVTFTIPVPSTTVSTSCPTSTAVMFTLKDEDTLTTITGNYAYNFNMTVDGTTYRLYGNISGTNNFSICINDTQSGWTMATAGEIQYYSTGYVNRRYYLFRGTRISTSTNNITLYALNSTLATPFQIRASASDLRIYDNNYVTLVRWYPELNQYNVVDMGLTDDLGETLLYVKTNDIDYRMGIYEQNGSLIYLANPIRMVCVVSPCTYSLKNTGSADAYTTLQNLQYRWDYNDTTSTWTFTYNDPSQASQTIRLDIYKQTGLEDVLICQSNLTGYTGAVSCETGGWTGTLKGVVTRTASPGVPIAQKIVSKVSSSFKSSYGLFITLILAVPIIFVLALVSPIAALIGGVIALIPGMYFGSISFTVIGALAIMGVIIIHFIRR